MRILLHGAAALSIALLLSGTCRARSDFAVPLPMPPKVALKTLGQGVGLVFANEDGLTFYTYDRDTVPGQSSCRGECAQSWGPVVAGPDARPSGEWSLVKNETGAAQWAFRNKPLYISKKFLTPNFDGDLVETIPRTLENDWHFATFDLGIEHPDGIRVSEIANSGGIALANVKGMPLYTFEGNPLRDKSACLSGPCANHWIPVQAPQLAHAIGDFSVADRDDGVSQWAYKGHPLFVFDGDTQPGDAAGSAVDKRWKVALLRRYFLPPGVTIRRNHFDGYNLATDSGMTIYQRDRFRSVNGGHSLREGSKGTVGAGKLLGTAGCIDECLRQWRPLKAPANARPSGLWSIAIREDGTRQWVYRSFALYTFVGDTKPGDMNGNDIYEMSGRWMGKPDRFIEAERRPFSLDKPFVQFTGAPGLVWHAVLP